jgi:hypothetical protein
MTDDKFGPIISAKKICQREKLKQSLNSIKAQNEDDTTVNNIKNNQQNIKNNQQNIKKTNPTISSALHPSQHNANFNNNCIKNSFKVDKNIMTGICVNDKSNYISSGYNKLTKETYDDEQIEIIKTNNIDVNVKVINDNEDLVKELEYYANKINECKIVDNFTLDDVSKIKERLNNLDNETTNLKLNYKSLITFTESMDELINYFTSLDKEITKKYNITDEELLMDLLNSLKKIYTLINTFEKIKVKVDINTQINLQLSTLELNKILTSVTSKITNINEQIINFMNGLSNKNINDILNFLNSDESEEINYALSHTLKSLDINLQKFDDSSRSLKNTLDQLKIKISQSKK